MLNDCNFVKINHDSDKWEFSWFDFFLCNFYSLKNVYKEHIIHPLLGEFSLFASPCHTLIYPILLEKKFSFCSSKVKPGHSLQEASDTKFPHDASYPKCQFDGNLWPVCSPNQCTCFKIHVRIKLLPIFCKNGFQAQHKC